jgi:hypothetical protein
VRRRDFIAGLGAAVWPAVARAQQPIRMRRIGVMLGLYPADDPEGYARATAFVQGLQERGWTDGRNVRIEFRWGLGDPERLRRSAEELVALSSNRTLVPTKSGLIPTMIWRPPGQEKAPREAGPVNRSIGTTKGTVPTSP